MSTFSARVLLVRGELPLEWVFPRCLAVVHHGGAGTCGSALRSATPQLVLLDIPDNGGYYTSPATEVTAESLVYEHELKKKRIQEMNNAPLTKWSVQPTDSMFSPLKPESLRKDS